MRILSCGWYFDMQCTLCPRLCSVDRASGRGYCGAPEELKIARAALHFWEEPPISGECGSGTVFFSHCPLQCVYCQNRTISAGGDGKVISTERLCEIFYELQAKGALNINLVSPTQYADKIADAIRTVKGKGFSLPFVWNTSGYERVETVLAKRYSAAENYPTVAKAALREMMCQQPKCVFDGERMTRGVIVRHLLLPGQGADSKDVVDVFDAVCRGDAWLSLMRQYTPLDPCPCAELNRPITDAEYDEVVEYALLCGIQNIFLQEKESVSESFIPAFDYEGVLKHGTEQ